MAPLITDPEKRLLTEANAAAIYEPRHALVERVSVDGTGSADTAAVQSALDAIASAGGGEVFLPQLTFGQPYRLGKLFISRNTTFRCAPGVVIKRKGVTYGISNVQAGVNPLSNQADPYSGHGNVKIIGGTWDGNILEESYLASGFNLFYFAMARGVVIEDVTVLDTVTNHCIDLNGVDGFVTSNSRFLGYKDATTDASRNYVEAVQVSQHVDDSSPEWASTMGTPSRNIVMDNCVVGASGTAGTVAFPAGIGTHTSSNDELTNNVTVRNCTFEGMSYAGVVAYTYNDVKVINNTFKKCAYGVRGNNFTNGKNWDKANSLWITGGPTRKETSGMLIGGNRFVDSTVADVSLLGTNADTNGYWGMVTDITVTGNICKATTTARRSTANIRVLFGKNVIIAHNQCENGAEGILVDTCVNATTSENRVFNTTTYGIRHAKGSTPPGTDTKYAVSNRILGNHVENAGSHGIGNNSLYFSTVEGNTVIDWGRISVTANGILTSGTDGSLVSGNNIRTAFTGLGAGIATATTATANITIAGDNKISKPDGSIVTLGGGVNSGNAYLNATEIMASASDPLAYLSSISVLCSWDTRPAGSEATFPQGVSINEAAGEIYVANQGGTLLRIDVRNMDGTLKSSKSITTSAGAYTEGMPWFYNGAGQLCFFIRTGVGATENTYNIYNYTLGTLGPQIAINGLWKASVQGNTLITTDARNETIKTIFVYDWASVQAGTPTLLSTIYVETSNETAAKNQGLVINGGYLFLLQGASGSQPTITVYNMAGRVVTILTYTRADFAAALNAAKPGLITDLVNYTYESEAGCVYQGKLVSMDVVNSTPATIATSKTVLTVRNVVSGAAIKPSTATSYVHDTGWINLTLLGTAVPYAGDTVPRIRRIGNQVYTEGAIKGVTSGAVDVATIPAEFLSQYNRQFAQIFGSAGQCSTWQVNVGSGTLRLLGVTSGTVGATSWLPLAATWLRA